MKHRSVHHYRAAFHHEHSPAPEVAHIASVETHHRNHGSLRLEASHNRQPVTPMLVKSTASLDEVHQAIHKASEVNGVSPNLAGAIAHLESLSSPDKQNSVHGSSIGLFQMRWETAQSIMADPDGHIAKALRDTGDDRYKDMIGILESHEKLSKNAPAAYNAIILDPYFNALLGTQLIKDNSAPHHFDVKSTRQMTEIYSMHLTGKLITQSDDTLASLGIPDRYLRANPMLAAGAQDPSSPTAREAYTSLSTEMRGHLDAFVADDKRMGLWKSDAPSARMAHGHNPVRHHVSTAPHA